MRRKEEPSLEIPHGEALTIITATMTKIVTSTKTWATQGASIPRVRTRKKPIINA